MDYASGYVLPKRTFVDAFRIVAWQFVVYREVLLDINPELDDCPDICAKFPSRKESDYCNLCDIKIARDAYEEAAKQYLDERLGDKWKKWTFEEIEDTILSIYNIKESDKRQWTITTSTLVSVLEGEINRQQRIKLWQDRQKAKNESKNRHR